MVSVEVVDDGYRFLHLAELRRPWHRTAAILDRDISLCETDEIPIGADWLRNVAVERLKDWAWEHFPRLY